MPRKQIFASAAEKQRAYRQRRNLSIRNADVLRNDKQLFKIERPPVRYYGGKWRIAEWIIDRFPVHTCYVEPFAGGASVLLQKQPSKFEVLNDLNHDVITFFDTLRGKTEDLIRAILLTPYSREELRRARLAEPTTDPLEQARRFYVRSWQSFGSGVSKSSTGWRYQIGAGDNSRASAVRSWNATDHLWAVAERLKQVQIECDDAYKVIERYDSKETLFYLDYPYVHSTRYDVSKGYSHELTDADHRRFAGLVHRVKGFVVVSGYPSALYDDIYAGWMCVQKETNDINGKKQTECLWLSPATVSLNNLPLFAQAT